MPGDRRTVDSSTKPDATGTAVTAGSHGGISSGWPTARQGVTGVVFNDAHVSDALSAWGDGVPSHANERAASLCVEPGDTPRDFVETVQNAE
ncbi:hypothetical protein ACFQPA_20795 [Halomarina halobia]|uniref:Uncharacterized protein n=1 Tax=Halomarina halobia TaxID=3033386 RepID=A0ABD6AEB9_9EURY|nr:hypothetical protein [Halomarina sp. PSR21]